MESLCPLLRMTCWQGEGRLDRALPQWRVLEVRQAFLKGKEQWVQTPFIFEQTHMSHGKCLKAFNVSRVQNMNAWTILLGGWQKKGISEEISWNNQKLKLSNTCRRVWYPTLNKSNSGSTKGHLMLAIL